MPDISQIIDVEISIVSPRITRAGFGTLMVMSPHIKFTDRIRFYSSQSAVLVDFDSTDAEAVASGQIFDETPSPTQIAIGRIQVDKIGVEINTAVDTGDVLTVSVDTVATRLYICEINAAVFNTEVTLGDSKASVATALAVAINAGGEPVTADASAGDGTFTITADVPDAPFTSTVRDERTGGGPNNEATGLMSISGGYSIISFGMMGATTTSSTDTTITIAGKMVGLILSLANDTLTATDDSDGTYTVQNATPLTAYTAVFDSNQTIESLSIFRGTLESPGFVFPAAETLTDSLNAIKDENNDWFGLGYILGASNVTIVIDQFVEIAAFVETETKLFFVASDDLDTINQSLSADTTSIGALLKATTRTKSIVMFHDKLDQFPELSWAGKQLPKDPGSTNWAFQVLSGVTPVTLNDTQAKNARDKNVNTFTQTNAQNITWEGTVASGEFIDVIRGVAFIKVRLTEDLFGELVSAEKIPFTDKGIAVIESIVRARLNQAIDQQILAATPAPIVTVPLAADVLPADKAARRLLDVNFVATLSGAINFVQVRGTVSA